MNHDGHNNCQHLQMAYCRMCDAVYCRACAREWPQRVWNFTSPQPTYPYYPWITTTTIGTASGGEAGSNTITTGGCAHT